MLVTRPLRFIPRGTQRVARTRKCATGLKVRKWLQGTTTHAVSKTKNLHWQRGAETGVQNWPLRTIWTGYRAVSKVKGQLPIPLASRERKPKAALRLKRGYAQRYL